MGKNNDDLANRIRRRANAVNISITQLCREAGVSRRWFEFLKSRTPSSLDLYLKIDEKLKEYEQSGTTPGTAESTQSRQ